VDGPAAPVILTMARIYPLKGIDVLLQAARLVQDRVPGARWRILGEVGDTAYHAHCLDLVSRLGLTENIEWGRTSNPAPEYHRADLFCLPSISEALPYCVLEAMFSGCPVVATDVGGVSEMLAGTGLVVPPRDPNALAQAIISLLSAEGRAMGAALAQRALSRARSMYTIARCSSRFREIYEEDPHEARIATLSAAG
jgi:glycosyltransferase involved in cell wall biosynthesis